MGTLIVIRIKKVLTSCEVSFGFVSDNILLFAYMVDIYLARADASLVVINGFKNLAAFVMSTWGVIPWFTVSGFTQPFAVLGCLLLVFHGFMLVIWWKGANIVMSLKHRRCGLLDLLNPHVLIAFSNTAWAEA